MTMNYTFFSSPRLEILEQFKFCLKLPTEQPAGTSGSLAAPCTDYARV